MSDDKVTDLFAWKYRVSEEEQRARACVQAEAYRDNFFVVGSEKGEAILKKRAARPPWVIDNYYRTAIVSTQANDVSMEFLLVLSDFIEVDADGGQYLRLTLTKRRAMMAAGGWTSAELSAQLQIARKYNVLRETEQAETWRVNPLIIPKADWSREGDWLLKEAMERLTYASAHVYTDESSVFDYPF